jgi:hypothetical protein
VAVRAERGRVRGRREFLREREERRKSFPRKRRERERERLKRNKIALPDVQYQLCKNFSSFKRQKECEFDEFCE